MIKVLQVNKVGNRIRSYVCTDGNGRTTALSKRQLTELIRMGRVDNASIQVYNGGVIIRIKDPKVSTVTITKEAERRANQQMARMAR